MKNHVLLCALVLCSTAVLQADPPAGPCGRSPCMCGADGTKIDLPPLVPPAPPTESTLVVVEMEAFKFIPSLVTITPGTTVRWINLDAIEHTATSQVGPGTLTPNGVFDSGDLFLNDTFDFTFTQPGAYYYFCLPHGSSMQGIVQVVPEPATLSLLAVGLLAMRRR